MNVTLDQLRPLRQQRRGFTLLEIMLVVMIIALLAGIAIVKMGGALDEAGDATAKAQLNNLSVALLTYRSKGGNYPSTEQGLKALMVRPQTEPVPRAWTGLLQSLPKDPWNHEYIYEYPGRHNPESYDIYSAGRNGKPGDDDDIGNWDQTTKP
jgi:general secretion pathway protein G